jgi:hypothetical protein
MNVHGYGADAALEGTTLTLTSTGKVGRGALGTDRREIETSRLKAIEFRPGNPIRNGHLILVDKRGKSVVHFRRKSNDEMARLYDAIAELAPEGAAETSVEGAPLFSEDADAMLAPMKAWAERKQAEYEEKQRAKQDSSG